MNRFTLPIFIAGVLAVLFFGMRTGHPRDLGQWERADPELKKWYSQLRQPDNPTISCCGEADAYWADSYEVDRDGNYVAIITDERDVPGRPPVPVGTKITVPKHKIKHDEGNPTGHAVIFVSSGPIKSVYCYVPGGGV